jgi:predicted RNA-binding Zn-ribbon protein involved in translation (DUF1610 family)
VVAHSKCQSCHKTSRKSKAGTAQAVTKTSTIQTKERKDMNNDENTDEQRTTEESLRLAEKLPFPTESPPGDVSVFPCPKCGKEFKSPPALRMHNIRIHGTGWSTSQNFFKGKRKIGGYPGMKMPKWSLARRRKFNATQRAKRNHTSETPKPAPRAVTPVLQSVNFCPRCGCNVEVVRKAIEFADRV